MLELQRVRSYLKAPARAPLDFWRHAAPQLRQATALCSTVDEVAVRAPNNGGKTEWGTAVVLACAMGRDNLDGIPLPVWPGRVDALELARDYKQQKLSTQQTYLRLIGAHPHRVKWIGDNVLSSLRVRHKDSTDAEETWSLITFQSQENRRAGLGARADIVRADEPPDREIWHEARKSAHANRRGLRLITYTPIKRPEWWWIKEEYGDGPRGCVRKVGEHWAEVRYSMEDNTVLSPERKRTLIDEFVKMGAIADARIHGDFVDASGECPFDEEALVAMLAECQEPSLVEWRVSRETDESGARKVAVVSVEVYSKPRAGAEYYIPIDPSAGVDDNLHDPAGLHVVEIGSGDLVARYVGAIAPFALGALAAGLARQYNNAQIQPEVNDGWGLTVLRGIHESHYGNIGSERRLLSAGEWSNEVGFRTTQSSRADMMGAIQAWLQAWKAGVRYGKCPSRKVIECLLDAVLDEKGKPVAAPGRHDEDLILRGQSLRKAVLRSGMVAPDLQPMPKSPDQDIIEKILSGSREDEYDTPFGQVAARARERPR